MDKFIPVNEPSLGEREKQLLIECIDTGWISSEGPFVEKFENYFSKKVNRKYGISCSSGTAALDLAVASLKIGPGDEVIIPDLTYISTANAVTYNNGKIVLCDSNIDNFNLIVDC